MAAGVGAAAVTVVAWYALTRKKPDPEEIERERRELLAGSGRITDGTIVEASLPGDEESTRRTIVYNYRIAGVSYECAQDVTLLAEHVRDIRADLPVQVRYDPHNPANSIIVAEAWSGLRLGGHTTETPSATSGNNAAF